MKKYMSVLSAVALPSILVCFFFTVTCFLLSTHVEAVGLTRDKFMPAPYRRGDTGFFAIPEILVELLPSVLGSRLGSEILKIERWEYESADIGQAVGYVKREKDGKLKMCACTASSTLLSASLRSELEYQRREQASSLTNYDSLELDKKIEDECVMRQAHQGCVDIVSVTPNPPSFCNVFLKEPRMYALPLAFSQQSYFSPGLRMLRDGEKGVSQGAHAAYKATSVYPGEYEGYSTGRSRGQTRFKCRGAKTFYEAIVGVKKGCGSIPAADEVQSGYAVARYDNRVCLHYKYNSNISTECVPYPDISYPTVSASVTGLNIKFPDCLGKNGKRSKYCDFDMSNGEVDPEFGFSVIKPKLNMDTYDFELVSQCLDEDGKVTGIATASSKCKSTRAVYVDDQNSNVTCFVNANLSFNRFYIKRGDRHHWIKELPKVLVASSFDRTSKKYAQCDDSKAIDLSRMHQGDIDKMVIRGSFYLLPTNRGISSANKQGGILCRDNMLYYYSNERAFPYSGRCSATGSVGVLPGYCKTRYESLDNFDKVFLAENEEPAIEHVIPLNPMLQGLCVSNFPTHSYEYGKKTETKSRVKDADQGKYVLEVSSANTVCDFLKIELWGAGEAGSLEGGGAGRAGEYAMGILKLDPKRKKYLTMNLGKGGVVDIANNSAKRAPGNSTVVSLCENSSGRECSMIMVAKGGGQLASQIAPKGLSGLVHYRLAEGTVSGLSKDEVHIPYQSDKKSSGRVHVSDAGCVRAADDNSSKIKAVEPSDFPGAGGCARTDVGLVQGGSHGMVKITCEKWSGSMGKVKEWHSSSKCDENTLGTLKTLEKHANAAKLSAKTQGLFTYMATEEFCATLEKYPLFTREAGVDAAIMEGDFREFDSKTAVDRWVKSAIRKLRGILNQESEILNLPFPTQGTSAAGKAAENMKLLTSSFNELLRSKTVVTSNHEQYDELVTFLRDYTASRGYDVTKLFQTLLHDDIAKRAPDNKRLVDLLQDMDKTVKKQGAVFADQVRAKQWVDERAATLGQILSNRDKKIVKVYDKLFSGNSAKPDKKVLSDSDVNNVTKVIVRDFKNFMDGEIVVSPSVKDKSDLADILKQLRKIAVDRNISSKDVFTQIARDDFANDVASVPDFTQAVKEIHQIVVGDKKAFDSKEKADAWVKDAAKNLGEILDASPAIIKAYDNVRKKAGKPAADKAVNKKELYESFIELIGTRAAIIDAEIYAALQLFRKYSYDAPLSTSSQQVFDELTDLDYVERISFAKDASLLTRYIRDIIHEGPGNNTADTKTPEGKKFRKYFDFAIVGDIGATMIGAEDSAKQLVFKRSFTELLDHVAADKISKQIKPDNVIKTLKQVSADIVQAGIQYDPRLDLLVSSGSLSTMKRANCYVMGLHYFAKAMQAIMSAASKVQLYRGIDWDNIVESALYDLRKCVEVSHLAILQDLGDQVTGGRGASGLNDFIRDAMGGSLIKVLSANVQPSHEVGLSKKMDKILGQAHRSNVSKALRIISDDVFLRGASEQFRGVMDRFADIVAGAENEFVTEAAARSYVHEVSKNMVSIFLGDPSNEDTYARLSSLMQKHPEFFEYPRSKSVTRAKQSAYQALLSSMSRQELLMHSSKVQEELKNGLGHMLLRKNVRRKKAINVTKEQIVHALRGVSEYVNKNMSEVGYVIEVMSKPSFVDLVEGTAFGEFLIKDFKSALDAKSSGATHAYDSVIERLNDVMQMKESIAILREYGRLYTEKAYMIGIVNPEASNAVVLNLAKENVPFGPTLTMHNVLYQLLATKARAGARGMVDN